MPKQIFAYKFGVIVGLPIPLVINIDYWFASPSLTPHLIKARWGHSFMPTDSFRTE